MEVICPKCRQPREFPQDFNRDSTQKNGYYIYCKTCCKGYSRSYYLQNKLIWRDQYLQATYGISLEDYTNLFNKQEGVCAICGEAPEGETLSVDHCHITNVVRGLLCDSCNNGVGRFKDDPQVLRNAAEYLERSLVRGGHS
jgi:hypothetical protein